MSVCDNKVIFRNSEFESWASRELLIPAEQFLIQNYLDKHAKTLEGGTGGGRILFAMRAMGFRSLHGFDFLSEFIEEAKKKDPASEICFEVQDATCLRYEDSFFDQVIYLQQVLCFIENDAARLRALQEAYRILRMGGTALFSFLSFEARSRTATYMPYLLYLRILRKLRKSNLTIQYLPWLRLGGKFNFRSLLDTAPRVYWYRLEEVYQLLTQVGLHVTAMGSTAQIRQGRMHESLRTMADEAINGMLYVVAKK